MYKKYLITGATGFLGRAVTAEIAHKGAEIYALTLAGDRLADKLPAGVHRVEGDVCNISSLENFFGVAGSDTCVIHCAGIVSVATHPGRKIYEVNVGGTKNIVAQCFAHNVGKLIYVSSVHAIPEKPKGTEISESYDFSPKSVCGDYAKSKAIATRHVLAAAGRGLNASIVFPSGIIGPGDEAHGSITSMLTSFLSGKLPIAVRGGYDFVDVRDVARGIAACAEYGEKAKCYILSGHYATIKDILSNIKLLTGIQRTVSYLPIGFARLVAPMYEKHSVRRKKPLFFTPYAVDVLNSNGRFSHRHAEQTLGYRPRSLTETLRDTVFWLRKRQVTAN